MYFKSIFYFIIYISLIHHFINKKYFIAATRLSVWPRLRDKFWKYFQTKIFSELLSRAVHACDPALTRVPYVRNTGKKLGRKSRLFKSQLSKSRLFKSSSIRNFETRNQVRVLFGIQISIKNENFCFLTLGM